MSETKKAASKPIADVAKPGKSAPAPTSKPVIVTNRPIMKDPMMVDETATDDQPEKLVTKSAEPIKLEPTNLPEETKEAEATPAPETASATIITEKNTPPGNGSVTKAAGETTTDDSGEPGSADADVAKLTHEKVIEPLAGSKPEAEETVTDTTEAKPASEAPTEAKTETETEAKAEPAEGTKETSENTTEKSEKAEESIEQTTKALEEEAAKQAEQEAAVQKLVANEQYFLPINAVEKRRAKRFVILGIVLSVVLIAAWADIALDAGIIQISGVKPVTHFFSN